MDFQDVLNQTEPLEIPEEMYARKHCKDAQRLSDWSQGMYERTVAVGDIVTINQNLLLLLKKYFECRAAAPKYHQNLLSSRGHICLYETFVQAFLALQELELVRTPHMLFLPPPPLPPPPPPPPPQIAGIFLGESDGM